MSEKYQPHNVNSNDFQTIEQLLGRAPRGLVGVPVRGKSGEPIVIQVASLVDKKPFPTLFWLVDKSLNYTIDQLEARGFIADIQQRIDGSAELQRAMTQDHRDHIALRHQLMPDGLSKQVDDLGFSNVFERRGIGGIENFNRIRCLHTYYASHLVSSNTVGAFLDDYWQSEGINFDHLLA